MAISGVVITLGPDGDALQLAQLLSHDPEVTLGPGNGNRIAAVIETTGPAADEAACARILAIPGVHTIEVIAVHLDDHADAAEVDLHGMPRLPCSSSRSA